jgi:hypothetical protein
MSRTGALFNNFDGVGKARPLPRRSHPDKAGHHEPLALTLSITFRRSEESSALKSWQPCFLLHKYFLG